MEPTISGQHKILVANRGEIACRIIRACRALELPSVAVYSEPDQTALHVAMADEAVPLGGLRPQDSYANAAAILDAAGAIGATAIHPGYGFLSENADFAQEVIHAGRTWIGSDAESIAAMGDKSRARALAQAAGVPVLPGSERFDDLHTEHLLASARQVGYPLLVKASGGGGGIGMKVVKDPADLEPAITSIRSMVGKAFGDTTLYLERYLPSARHIEVQIFGLGDGSGIHLYERDCSVQRRFQKILEEAPAPDLPESVREELRFAALALVERQKYSGAGTVEFIVDKTTHEPYFLEMNTRIQVEHPVTEMITGIDLVQWQILHALGQLPAVHQRDIQTRGHAIQCRIYAERPERNFLPAPGQIERLEWPTDRDGVRVDAGVRNGDEVTPFYDPLLGKIIVRDDDRSSAVQRMSDTLDELSLVGVGNNADFLKQLLRDPAFSNDTPATNFVEEVRRRQASERATR